MNRDKPIPAADIEKAANISLAEPALLEKIDKLFELNIGEDVALPQVRPCWLENRKIVNQIKSLIIHSSF